MKIVERENMNEKQIRSRLDYNTVNWSQYVEYSEESPTGLIWVNCNNVNYKHYPGEPAGSPLYYKSGRPRAYQVRIEGKSYLVHRIIICMVHGKLNKESAIDHIDGNAFNNKISNLRIDDKFLNNRNISLRKDSKTFVNGVYKMNNGSGGNYYVSTWYENGVQKSKYFSVNNLTEEIAFDLAKSWRINKIKELNLRGAGYTERHGT